MEEKSDGKKYSIINDPNAAAIKAIMHESNTRTTYNADDMRVCFVTILKALEDKNNYMYFSEQGSNVYTFTIALEGKHQLQIQVTEIRNK